mgnify:FL=1
MRVLSLAAGESLKVAVHADGLPRLGTLVDLLWDASWTSDGLL